MSVANAGLVYCMLHGAYGDMVVAAVRGADKDAATQRIEHAFEQLWGVQRLDGRLHAYRCFDSLSVAWVKSLGSTRIMQLVGINGALSAELTVSN